MQLSTDPLDTPSALIDVARMQRNIERMQAHLDDLDVDFRPHAKTSKCSEVVQAQLDAGARGLAVSTLKEAEKFFADGVTDLLYAVGIAAHKLPRALALRKRGCDLKLVTDSVAAATALVEFGHAHEAVFEVWLEVDIDGHRSGLRPESAELIAVGRALHEGGMQLGGVMTHAGSSHRPGTPAALVALAEQERAGCVRAAERLRAAGLPCVAVSIGSTPTALSAKNLAGVTEVRAGSYVFFDLAMHDVGVCRIEDIALSVLTTVIGHQRDKGWAIVDAGWMAMGREHGGDPGRRAFGDGQVCDEFGALMPGWSLSGTTQEHGIVSCEAGEDSIESSLPIGTRLRILPYHAGATGAQFPAYRALLQDGKSPTWDRLHGW